MEALELLERAAQVLWPLLLSGMGLSIIWVCLLAGAARAIGNRNRAAENLAWRLALAGLAATFAIPIARDLVPAPPPSFQMTVLPEWQPVAAAEPLPASSISFPTLPALTASSHAPTATTADPPPPSPVRWPIAGALLGLWVCVAACRIAQLLREYYKWHRIRAAAAPAPPELQDAAADLSRRIGCRRTLPVRIATDVEVPITFGILRPVILLPAVGPPCDPLPVLAPEIAHAARGDLLVRLALRWIQAILFLHPLLPLVARRLDDTAEAVCDDWVLHLTGNPLDYARVLLAWAERRAPMAALAAPFPAGDALQRRVSTILNPNRHRHTRISTPVSLVAAAALVALVLAAGELRLAYSTPQGDAIPMAPSHSLNLLDGFTAMGSALSDAERKSADTRTPFLTAAAYAGDSAIGSETHPSRAGSRFAAYPRIPQAASHTFIATLRRLASFACMASVRARGNAPWGEAVPLRFGKADAGSRVPEPIARAASESASDAFAATRLAEAAASAHNWFYTCPPPGDPMEHSPLRALPMGTAKPDGLRETAGYRGARRRYAEIRFGGTDSVPVAVALDEVAPGDADLYLDADRNRAIEDSEKAPGAGGVWRAPLAVAAADGTPSDLLRRVLVFRLRGDALSYAAAGYLEGTVLLDGIQIPTRRVDGDGNGLLTDPQDRLLLDLDGNGQWDPLAEQFPFTSPIRVCP